MSSSWLLFRIFRRRLWICLFIETVVTFLMALHKISAHQPHSVRYVAGLSLIFAACLSLWVCSPHRFNTLPFPVSVRQRAWLPLLGFALVWAAGSIAILAALLCLGVGPFRLAGFFFSALTPLPLYLLGFLLALRILRTKPHLVGFVGMVCLIPQTTDSSWYKACAGTYHLWWPAVVMAIAFYLYEAPILLARRDRLLVGQTGHFRFFRIPDVTVASPRNFVVWIGDTIEASVLLAITLLCLFGFLLVPGDWLELGFIPVVLVLLFVAWLVVCIFMGQYQTTAASGFSPASALGMTMMQMTLALYPLAQALGVKKGVVARCGQCRMAKFLWSPHCPHCGYPGLGTIASKELALVAQGKPIASHWRVRFMRRVFIPVQLFCAFGLAFSYGSRPFVTHGKLISFIRVDDPQARQRAMARIENLVSQPLALQAWLSSKLAAGGSVLRLPERFRLEVTPQDDGIVRIRGFGLRWDSAEGLSEALAQRLAEEIEEVGKVDSVDVPKEYVRSPIFRMRGYLDNRIHWLESRK